MAEIPDLPFELGRIATSNRQYALDAYAVAFHAFPYALELPPVAPVAFALQKPLAALQLVLVPVLGLRDYFQIRPST